VFGIIHRMILWELLKIFVLSLIGITGILLMGGLMAEAAQQGLNPTQFFSVIPFLIPSTLPYTLPATTLFATCLVYGRLAHDNEILVIRAAGVSVLRVVTPAVVLGAAMSIITMILYYHIIPYSHHLMRTIFFKDVEELLYTVLQKDRQVSHPRLGYALFVREVQGRKLTDAIFKHRNEKGEYDLVAWAHEAELRVDLRNKVLHVHMMDTDARKDDGSEIYYQDKVWEVPLPPNMLDDRPRRPRDMTWNEILAKRSDIEHDIADIDNQFALYLAPDLVDRAPPQSNVNQHLKNLKEAKKTKRAEDNALITELHVRPALSVGCLFFVLVGCPIGIWFSKSDYLSAFITCFVPIMVVYYPLLLCGSGLAKDGKISPYIGVWIADGIMLLTALVLYRKLTRH
jgi:lipopolysaccharide export system permease protein